MSRRNGFLTLTVAVLMLAMTGISASPALSATPVAEATPTAGGATREVINEGLPSGAPGEELELVRYVIAPNAVLPVHTHPGMQVNVIESGTLHYTVVEGTVTYTRAAGIGTPAAAEELTSGQSIDFQAGDSFVEPEGMVHFGENRTSEPIVILTASLFEEGEPPSTVVEATPAP